MHLFVEKLAQRPIDEPLPLDPVPALERGALDGQREMAFAATVMPGMADMMIALVVEMHARGFQRFGEAPDHLARHGSVGFVAHPSYICGMGRKAYDGRVENAEGQCAAPGCAEPGQYRAPVTPGDFDGPGAYRLMCLDHIREHNARYDFFAGMSAEEILAAQSPIPEHGRRARDFSFMRSGDPGPAWADFNDPLDAIAARFKGGASVEWARAASRFSGREQHALDTLGLDAQADLHTVRRRYSALVRQYHPDRNGGDRSHEARLTRVIEAWQVLRKASAFA